MENTLRNVSWLGMPCGSSRYFLSHSELFHVRKALPAADYGAYSDEENVDQEMLLGPVRPRVRQNRKVNKEVSTLTHRQAPPALSRVILASSSTGSKVPVMQ